MSKYKGLHQRFEESFIPEPNSGCWIFIGSISPNGYGRMKYGDQIIGAHRISWLLHRGPITKHILHHCDVRCCVNPDHLYEGTPFDNVQDAIKRNRRASRLGEKAGGAKLNPTLVLAIRADFRPHKDIAKDYGISRQSVGAIKQRVNWGHV